MPSSQILLTEEFVEKMLEDLEDLTSPEEVSLFHSNSGFQSPGAHVCLSVCQSPQCGDGLDRSPCRCYTALFLAPHHPPPHPSCPKDTGKLSESTAPENLMEEAARAFGLVVFPQPLLFPGRF